LGWFGVTIIDMASRAGSPAIQFSHQVGRVVMWVRPDGWQSKARRNAWSSMVADRQRRNDRVAERESRSPMSPAALVL
jgi:hypothetical protein